MPSPRQFAKINSHRGVRNGSIKILNARFENRSMNQGLRAFGSRPCGQRLWIEGNRFSGRDVQVLLMAAEAPLGDVVVTNNVFLGSADSPKTVGINLNLLTPGGSPNIRITNNTFLNVTHWMGLALSKADHPGVTVANNLILGSQSIEGWSDPALIERMAQNWRFASNWWEVAADTEPDAGLSGRIAELKPQIELSERNDIDHADFLRPPPNSPLFASGCTDGGLPGYIGARGPTAHSQD
jgi:hypothetical protein